MSTNRPDFARPIADELSLPANKVAATLRLLDEGNTVPFVARYRKEATGGLDEVQLRAILDRNTYLGDLHDRRESVLASIAEQGKLTSELERKLRACTSKSELEDLYLPYKRKRRTRALIAREKGLEPLAQRILDPPRDGHPRRDAERFVSRERNVEDVDAALKGARDIVAEIVAEDPEVRGGLRDTLKKRGVVATSKRRGVEGRTKFENYYDFGEPARTIPSHRYLAICRGEAEGILSVKLEIDDDAMVDRIVRRFDPRGGRAWREQLELAIADGYKRLLLPSVGNDVRVELKMHADREAVDVFASNLRNLLLAAPLGGKRVVAIDPGIRTGCKCIALDETGTYLDSVTIYPLQSSAKKADAERALLGFARKHRPDAIGIGNGTGGRETEAFVRRALAEHGFDDVVVVSVNEAGASIYSASDIAREEFPDLDLTFRGAISIGRRLQDPLAELVKIDPKSIGVGQYQHDVYQPLLKRKLDEVVESCVNHVGVTVNTASAPLLSYVAGIGPTLAERIVEHRGTRGPFRSRRGLLDVSGVGARTFEQAAGFLRLPDGDHPLDGSAVHPERYALVERMARDTGVPVDELVGNAQLAERIDHRRYVGDEVGELTLSDIVDELKKPGRDPRDSFEPPRFRDDVNSMDDLREGMVLEGVVTNVTNFGAFVDIGVHQDGLIHISQLADRFVRDPSDVVRVGDRVNVRVLSVDVARKRIALSSKPSVVQN